jgi:hypothetical protein
MLKKQKSKIITCFLPSNFIVFSARLSTDRMAATRRDPEQNNCLICIKGKGYESCLENHPTAVDTFIFNAQKR